MNITILTYGSRGDVQPFLPLSLGLMERGHRVKLAAPFRFKELVEGHGIRFAPLAGQPEDLSRRLNDAGYNFIRMVREMMNHTVEIGAEIVRQTADACEDADLILHTFIHVIGAHTLAREKNIPDMHVQSFPMFAPTGDYPNVTMPNLGIRPLNRLTHILSNRITWWTSLLGYEQVRRRAGLPKRRFYYPFDGDPLRPPTPILCAWSPSVLPPSREWGPNTHVLGYYFLDGDDSYRPPNELRRFLEGGKAPICVSFGSMVNRESERIDGIVRGALERTHNRGILLSGWSGVRDRSGADLLYLNSVPHDWLLTRCTMIVHHGGAGTTAAGLRAGIPNIVVPFTADQPFWGGRVHAIGAGPRPIPVTRLSVDNLTQAMIAADRDGVRGRARALGQTLSGEEGVKRAVTLIETYKASFWKF